MEDILTATFWIGILASGIRLATPYLFAALGETLGQRSGVLNHFLQSPSFWIIFSSFRMVIWNIGERRLR